MLAYLLTLVEGDEEAVQKVSYIYDKFHEDMMRFAKSRLKQAGRPNYDLDSEDIVQEALLRITKYHAHFDLSLGDKKSRAYTFMVIANVLKDELMHHIPVTSIDDYEFLISDEDEDFINDLHMREQYNIVMAAIDRLPEIYRIVFVERYKRGNSTQVIAAMMEISLKTVETRLCRGRVLLRQLLEGKL